MFINIGGFNLVQRLMAKCLALIDANIEIFEAFEYDEAIHYKYELAEKIITIFQACVNIVSTTVRHDREHQE